MKKTSGVLLSILLPLLTFCLQADYSESVDRSPVIKKWTSKNGLPQRTVHNIMQDRDGYLWIGTQEGVARFDGEEFLYFNETIGKQYVFKLFQDSIGAIWVGTFGNGLIRLFRNSIKKFNSNNSELKSDIIRGMTEGEDGEIFLATQRGLFRVYRQDVSEIVLPAPYNRIRFNDITFDREKRLLAATEKGILIINREMNIVRAIDKASGLKSNIVQAVGVDRRGRIIAGTRNGLSIIDKNSRVKTFTHSDGLADNIVTSFEISSDGDEIVVGTERGASILSGDNFVYSTHLKKMGERTVWDVHKDREGNYWIGSGDGLKMFYRGNVYNISSEEGLADDSTWALCEVKDGELWVGTRHGVSVIRNGKVTGSLKDVANIFIRAIFKSSKGDIWIGTEAGIYLVSNGRTKRITMKDGLVHNVVKAFAEDDDGNIWIGTQGGVSLYKKGTFKNYTVESGLTNNGIRRIIWKDGKLWLATDGGLNCYSDGKFTSYNTSNGIADNVILSISHGRDGELWISTFSGLTLMKNGKFYSAGKEEGLFSDFIYEVVEDNSGKLWMSCNRGIFFINKERLMSYMETGKGSLSCTVLDETDGMKDSECNGGNHCSGLQDSAGNLWFVTVGGVCKVTPESYRRIANSSRVTLETLSIDSDNGTIIDGPVVVPPGAVRMEIHYSSICYREPEEVKYSFFLEGYDKDWVEAGGRKTAYYTNPDPGVYTFYVRARNREDRLETLQKVSILIKPFFYQTVLFKVFMVMAILMTGFLLYRLRIRNLRQYKVELERLVALRTKELKDAALRDPLTGLQNRRFLTEIIETEISAFIGLKNYALRNKISRRTLPEEAIFGIIMFDIDHFKKINDTYGHKAGDMVLQQFSTLLRSSVRSDDIVVRWGGEEFMVVLKKTHRCYMDDYIGSVLQDIRTKRFDIGGGKTISLTSSAGAVGFPCDDKVPEAFTFEQTVVLADNALYFSKKTGRNRATQVVALDKFARGVDMHQLVGNLKWGIRNEYIKLSVIK